jgi:hypothetical protein
MTLVLASRSFVAINSRRHPNTTWLSACIKTLGHIVTIRSNEEERIKMS